MQPQSPEETISIIKNLGADDHLKKVWYRVNGYDFDYIKQSWVKKSKPIMNEDGIRNLMINTEFALRMDFSNMHEDDIPKVVLHYFKTHYAHFCIYAKDFELLNKNKNIVQAACWLPIYIAARNAKGAGHRNVIRATFSEEALQKMAAPTNKRNFIDVILGRKK